jgi:chlorobactene glucosyltransferase
MPALLCGAVWLGFILYLLSRILRQFRNYGTGTLPQLANPRHPTVSIIVPVRNEIRNIAACLAGLTRQTGLAAGSRVTIVDDGSEDGTPTAIRRILDNPAVELISAGDLPDGWIGKPHACWVGASASTGSWLCFIDADVRVDPGLVAFAVAAAEERRLDMLSLHPRQELGSFWERLVMPAGLLLLACVKPIAANANALSTAADANGQFILIRRQVYFAVGGHAAVASDICEDRALAERVLRAGYCFRALAAAELATTRMYCDLPSLWEGLAKNACEILDNRALTAAAAIAGAVVGWAVMLAPLVLAPAILPAPSASDLIGLGLAASGSAVALGVQMNTARHFRIPAVYGLLMPLGYTMAALLVCHGLRLRRTGRVGWKGRRYDLRREPSDACL